MLPNTQLLNHQITAKSHVFKPKVTSALMLLSLLGLGAVILASQAHAAENVAIKPNLYAEKYVEQNGSHLKSLNSNPDTKLELSKNQEEDNTRMLENGYDMMGSSAFVETNIPAAVSYTHLDVYKRQFIISQGSRFVEYFKRNTCFADIVEQAGHARLFGFCFV